MYKHRYECAVCGGTVNINSPSITNPLAGTLHTHGGVVDSEARKSDPFLAGAPIDSALGKGKQNCAGGLIHKGPVFDTATTTTAAAPVARTPAMIQAEEVYADMKKQFKQWHGQTRDRGAWWGPAGPGVTIGAKDVPQSVVTALKSLVERNRGSWRFSDSFSGGISFHRTHSRSQVDFIYHMKRP